MKPLTISMALESGKYMPNTVVNTTPGSMRVGNHTIRDTHNYGPLTLGGIIQNPLTWVWLKLPYLSLMQLYRLLQTSRFWSAFCG